MAKLTFTIKRVKNRNDIYAEVIGTKLDCDNKIWKKELRRDMEICGDFPISLNVGDTFECEVSKKIDKRTYSPYFELINVPKRIGLENETYLAKFIRNEINSTAKSNDKLQKWKISVTCSKKIVQYLGVEAIKIIINKPEQLLLYPDLKMNDDKIFEMQRIMKRFEYFDKIFIALKSSRVPTSIIYDLYNKYGEKTLNIVLKNPYQICYDGNIVFRVADKIAYDNHFDKFDEIRIKTAIIDFIKYKRNSGNICILRSQVIHNKEIYHENLCQYLNRVSVYKFNDIPEDVIEKQIDELLLERRLLQEINNNEVYLYLPEMHRLEELFVGKLKEILDNSYNKKFATTNDINDFLFYYENKSNFKLDDLQKDAVKNALQNGISILTGGPGTGKTATVSVIVEAIKYLSKKVYNKEPDFLLAAPTGKAAERMTELTNEPAATIHRLLDLKYYETGDINEVDTDILIVDEGSMIDLELMYKLLRALTERTRLLIVGDSNQLPSVGPGNVLKDLIASGKIPSVELKTIFRQAMGSAIVESSTKIVQGLDSKQPNGIVLTNDVNRNFRFIKDLSIEGIKNKIICEIDELLNNNVPIKNIQLLTPKRGGELGTEVFNSIMQEKYNNNPVGYENDEGLKFKVGDKVIQTTNNYNLRVFNGYIGTITNIDSSNVVNGTNVPTISVEYENCDDDIIYEGLDIYQLELAYALTIHKSQGSEYPYVLCPIHLEQNIMLNRNLLYTGITRARNLCLIFGDDRAADKAIKTTMSKYERISCIEYKVKNL